jgi:hypothetical protein
LSIARRRQADSALREKNNANIVQSELRYAGGTSDRLFSEDEQIAERRAG